VPVEILQNCIIFNDHAFEEVSNKETKEDCSLKLEAGAPLIFGKERNKGLRLKGLQIETVEFDPEKPPQDLIIHDPSQENPTYANLLARMETPEHPIPLGIFRCIKRATYDELVKQQVEASIQSQGPGDLEKLLNSGDTWKVE